jgi:hypothetical protein
MALMLLSGCVFGPPTAAPASDFVTPTLMEFPSAAPPSTAIPADTPTPTEPTRVFVPYRHRSGVFSIAIPDDWEVIDASTDRRLDVRFIPPAGYGSRLSVDITNEGTIAAEDFQALIESYIRLHYEQASGYELVNRSGPENGVFQADFSFDDGQGATGSETLRLVQSGPYVAALRVFLAERDRFVLQETSRAMSASFSVDSVAIWGSKVAAINPAELLIINTLLWQGRDDMTYYMGEVFNASPVAISDVIVKAVFCSETGIILVEKTKRMDIRQVNQNGAAPFSIGVEGLEDDVTICNASVTASPARPDPGYTSALTVTSTPRTVFRQVIVSGQVANPTLSPVYDIQVIIALYDSETRIIGYGVVELEPALQLLPGETTAFEYTFPELGGQADRYVTFSQAAVIRASNPSLLPTQASP